MLKSRFFRAILFFLLGTLLIIYGIAVEKYRIFPFEQIRYVKNIILPASKPYVKPRATLFDYFSPQVDVVMIGDSITQNAIWSEIFPNILGIRVVTLSFRIPVAILAEATLSFIGLGIAPPASSWGTLASDGWTAIKFYPHLILFPSLAIFFTIWSFNFLGEWLREYLDPRAQIDKR